MHIHVLATAGGMYAQIFTPQFWGRAFFALLGCGLLYMQWGRAKLRAYVFSELLETFNMAEATRHRFEIIIFVFVGTAIAMGVAAPNTIPQAFSAGLGWTGLAARSHSDHKTRSKDKQSS
jgi:hypothetical protein